MPIEVTKYTDAFRLEWEGLVEESINGTFLHKRAFLEYHGDRFQDFSLMAWQDRRLLGVFAAERNAKSVYSHRGLSYGGWIFAKGLEPKAIKDIVQAGMGYFKKEGVEKLYIRSIPGFYFSGQEAEVISAYLPFNPVREQKIFQTAVNPFVWNDRGKRWGARQAEGAGLEISQDIEFLDTFWKAVLLPNLKQRHNTAPAHSLEEIKMLIDRFSGKIHLFTVIHGHEVLAGSVVFEMPKVVHCQYIASNPKGRKLRALDLLMRHLMIGVFPDKQIFSFGVSHEPRTGERNEGLYAWKKSLGAIDYPVLDYWFSLADPDGSPANATSAPH